MVHPENKMLPLSVTPKSSNRWRGRSQVNLADAFLWSRTSVCVWGGGQVSCLVETLRSLYSMTPLLLTKIQILSLGGSRDNIACYSVLTRTLWGSEFSTNAWWGGCLETPSPCSFSGDLSEKRSKARQKSYREYFFVNLKKKKGFASQYWGRWRSS